MITRRNLFEAAGGLVALSGIGSLARAAEVPREQEGEPALSPSLPAGTRAEAVLDTLPGKKPLIKLTYRPPNYETPFADLGTPITPNDAFFVRYHLADIPSVQAEDWQLSVGGPGADGELKLGLAELKKLPAFELVAVCQCSGNRRGLFEPHVAGVQWGNGAMGCARWKGARLKDVLDLVGLKKEVVEITFDGADGPVLDTTPDFVKSLPIWKAVEDTTLIAYEMNGEPLPHWNGFPARIIVPGWTATYWVKHVTRIGALTKPFDGFWMKTAYRIPVGKFPLVERFLSQENAVNMPITEILVNSLITSPNDGTSVRAGHRLAIRGMAWDGGYGIISVELSPDNGESWVQATLGEDFGNYAVRPWMHEFTPKARGTFSIKVRATNRLGQTQPNELIQNASGYYHNIVQTLRLDAV
ncbi:MAG TPA: molybdopterin-dependent oxidoreductase [Methylocella sp.]|nr:molybdopterin-dependent oxidoreductase [Methylocella sp.]